MTSVWNPRQDFAHTTFTSIDSANYITTLNHHILTAQILHRAVLTEFVVCCTTISSYQHVVENT